MKLATFAPFCCPELCEGPLEARDLRGVPQVPGRLGRRRRRRPQRHRQGRAGRGPGLPLFPVSLRQGLPLDLLRELVVEEHVGPIGKIGQDLVEALRALG